MEIEPRKKKQPKELEKISNPETYGNRNGSRKKEQKEKKVKKKEKKRKSQRWRGLTERC